MKKGLLLALAILCCASLAFAQSPGSVAVYADQAGSSCSATAAGFLQLYYFQAGSPGATAVEFHSTVLEDTPAGALNFFGDNSPFTLKQNNFHGDCSIAYQACLSGDIYLGSSAYGVNATPAIPPCTYFYVTGVSLPSIENSTVPIMVDCGDPESNLLELRGSFFVINPTDNCPCPGTIPNEESSWGQIKSLYQ
jgi:hypothetical protein